MEDRSILDRAARPADAEMYFADPSRPLIVLIHGGFWRPEYDLTHLRPMASALADTGWPTALIEYTRIPGRPDLMVNDIKSALDSLPGEIILMGHSAGGHLALWAASHAGQRLQGVIALAPVADLELARELDLDEGAVRDWLGEFDQAPFQPEYDSAVIIHGTGDVIVPIEVAEAYVSRHDRTRLVRVPDEGHFALIDPQSRAWPMVIDELARLLA